jgi:hypothetical protein
MTEDQDNQSIDKAREVVQNVANILQKGSDIQKAYIVQEMNRKLPEHNDIIMRMIGSQKEYDRLSELTFAVNIVVDVPEPSSEFPVGPTPSSPLNVTIGPFHIRKDGQ